MLFRRLALSHFAAARFDNLLFLRDGDMGMVFAMKIAEAKREKSMNKALWPIATSALAVALFATGLWVSRPTVAACQRAEQQRTATDSSRPPDRFTAAPARRQPAPEII